MDTVKFEELQIDDRILRAVTDMGFEEASPIQAKAIPVQMEGLDILCFRRSIRKTRNFRRLHSVRRASLRFR